MPSYKSHAIHGELILLEIDKKIEIKKEDLKVFCFGPDTLIATDYKTFSYQHKNRVKDFFEALIKYIKDNKLQNNGEVMAFLYGQLDHYIVDLTCHPLIYYMTEGLPKENKIAFHGLVEMWIDDYIMEKYNKKEMFYFKKWFLKNKEVRALVNILYKELFDVKNESLKYSLGITVTNLLDSLARTNAIGLAPLILKTFNIGDLVYGNPERALPYLNFEKKEWTHPITGEILTSSFDDLWKKSCERSLETIQDVNKYLYSDRPLYNQYISNNVSYDTGFPCEEKRTFQFIKKY